MKKQATTIGKEILPLNFLMLFIDLLLFLFLVTFD